MSLTVWLGSPSSMRGVLFETPILTLTMVTIVLFHIAWAMARMRRAVSGQGVDRQQRWVSVASEIFPPALVRLVAAELTVIHMALLRWGGPADVPANARAFAYHRHLTPICAALLILSVIKIAIYHLLVRHWSRTTTLVMFFLSEHSHINL